jgi:RecJ-like exonuclease
LCSCIQTHFRPDLARWRDEAREVYIRRITQRNAMPKDKKKPCKNCEGKGLIKNGDRKVKCQRCGGTGVQS